MNLAWSPNPNRWRSLCYHPAVRNVGRAPSGAVVWAPGTRCRVRDRRGPKGPGPARLGVEQRLDELTCVEGVQVLGVLADADVTDRKAQLVGHGDGHPAPS